MARPFKALLPFLIMPGCAGFLSTLTPMPLTSADIAAQIAAGQQAHTMNLYSSDLITNYLHKTHDPQFGAADLAGHAVNTVGAVAVPSVSLGLGLMGLDPIGLGMKGFGAGRALGLGVGASLGVGAGAFTVGTVGAMAAAFAAQQMHLGMQQQQHFMKGMQASYNFQTPQGMGFTNQQLGFLGGSLRQMSGQIGPLGQMISFEELGALAQNMGQMGMARGVQDVTQFTQNFRRMVESIKYVAKELGTSLQEAQQMMGSMRNSGIFSTQGQIQMASEMRSMSIAGNLALPELVQMSGIGSRVSRAVGGLGVHGAFAGVRTLGNIGLAMQVGALTDEDIYNATGLRGAEGRQALAASQLQGAAGWLRTGRGRRFLASIAGNDGNLDEEAVRAWQTGDMGVGNTMSVSNRRLNQVGRANFIRNEGRLRGAALAAFGGNIPAMALGQWAASKGIDINDMDDRSIIFAQRQLGMSREEVESSLKILQSLPKQIEETRRSSMIDAYRSEVAAYRRTSGMEGAKRKLEAHREHLQNWLQGKGQEIYGDLVSYIEDWLDKKMGVAINQATKDVDAVYASAMQGRGGTRAEAMLGIGSGRMSNLQSLVGSLDSRISGTVSGLTPDKVTRGSWAGVSIADKLRESGYTLQAQQLSIGRTDVQSQLMEAVRNARLGNDKEALSWGSSNKDLMLRLYSTGGMQHQKGTDRARAVGRELLAQATDPQTEALAKALIEGDARSMNVLASLEKGAEIEEAARIGANSALGGGLSAVLGGMANRTDAERTKDYSTVFSTKDMRERDEDLRILREESWWKRGARHAIGYSSKASLKDNIINVGSRSILYAMTGVGGAIYLGIRGALFDEKDVKEYYGQGLTQNKFQGEFLKSEEGLALSRDVLSGVDRSTELRKKLQTLKEGSEERDFYDRALRLNELTVRAKKEGFTISNLADDLAQTARVMQVSYYEQTDINRRQAAGRFAAAQQERLDKLRRVGILDEEGNLNKEATDKLAKMGIKEGSKAYELLTMGNKLLVEQAGLTAERASDEAVEGAMSRAKEMADKIDSSSYATLKQAADAKRAIGDYEGAAYLQQQADQRRRIERYTAHWAGAGAGTAMALGIKLDQKDIQQLAGMQQGDARITAFLAYKLGISGSGATSYDKDLKQLQDDLQNKKITTEEYNQKKAALNKKAQISADEAFILERLGSGKDGVNEKGISAEERNRRLMAILNSEQYSRFSQNKEEEKRSKDPSLQHLSKIAETLGDIKTSFTSLPGNIALAMLKAKDGEAPSPNTKGG